YSLQTKHAAGCVGTPADCTVVERSCTFNLQSFHRATNAPILSRIVNHRACAHARLLALCLRSHSMTIFVWLGSEPTSARGERWGLRPTSRSAISRARPNLRASYQK